MKDLLDRIESRINLDGECWLWTGARTAKGYASIRIDKKRPVAHRVLYELVVGEVPEGFVLDHLCRIRHCVNPDHLEVVTHRENILRGEGHGAVNARKVLCKRGHPLEGENLLRVGPGGKWRWCLECRRSGERERGGR